MTFLKKAYRLYADGFKGMGWLGKRLWLILFIKLFIMFAILKLFFFPNFLNSNYKTDQEKSDHIINEITKVNQNGSN
jgi:hypothetical protein